MSSAHSPQTGGSVAYPGVLVPMAPALMRAAYSRALARILGDVQQAGFHEIRAAHMPLFQFPGPHAASPGEISRRTGLSKQHVNLLLGDLERSEYLLRGPDPGRSRGKLVWLTGRGMSLMAMIKQSIEAIEHDWAATLGARRFDALKRALQQLNESEAEGS